MIDNGDGTYRPNDIKVNPEDYWMSVCRNAPSMFIYDNSYIKCREITLTYQFPKKWLGKVVQDMSISFVTRNPFIVWKNIPTSILTPTTTTQPVWDLNMVRCLRARAMVSTCMLNSKRKITNETT